MRTRSFVLPALFLVGGLLAACGDDDGAATPTAVEVDNGGDDTSSGGDNNGSSEQPVADGTPSAWYSALDGLDMPPAGTAYLTLDGVTSQLDVSYCEYSLNNMVVDEIPQENADDVFKLSVQLGGIIDDGRHVSVFAFRLVNPDKMGADPYETDSVQFNANDGESTSVASRAHASRPDAGGPPRDGAALPILKIDGASVTAVGEATPMGSAAGDEDMAVTGPFELAVTCD